MLQPTAFATVPSQQKIDINLPFGAAPGDKVTFSIPNGLGSLTTFSAVVPQPAMAGTPMTKISVTVPVPAALPPGTPPLHTMLMPLTQVPVTAAIEAPCGIIFCSYALLARPARMAQVLAWWSSR